MLEWIWERTRDTANDDLAALGALPKRWRVEQSITKVVVRDSIDRDTRGQPSEGACQFDLVGRLGVPARHHKKAPDLTRSELDDPARAQRDLDARLVSGPPRRDVEQQGCVLVRDSIPPAVHHHELFGDEKAQGDLRGRVRHPEGVGNFRQAQALLALLERGQSLDCPLRREQSRHSAILRLARMKSIRVATGSCRLSAPGLPTLAVLPAQRAVGCGLAGGVSQHLMLVPSLACPASCAYCFGPHAGGTTMGRETLEAVVEWRRALAAESAAEQGTLEITFHGGEPLVPGARWYREALPLLRDGLAPRRVRFAAQSNLWLLTDELCDLFREYGISLGTSLDGPEAINDAQRGTGYFAKTMAGIERARAHGLDVGAICTFTAGSVAHAPEIFDFFVREGLNFSVHAALPSLRYPEADRWSITPDAHGELLVGLLDRYLENLTKVRISTLDSMARSVSAGRGGICTFGECLGGYLAVGPDGAIYPCQRFAGIEEYRVGDVAARPSLEELRESTVWREFRAREEHVREACADCAYFGFCKGGCPYNSLVGAGGVLAPTARDPHCVSYRRAFDAVTERAMAEMFSPENLDAVVERPDPDRGLMRRGPLLSIMRDGPRWHKAVAIPLPDAPSSVSD